MELAEQLLTGIIELSSGVSGLRGAAEQLSSGIAMAAFMLGWAGISVHCQVLSFLCEAGVSARTYLLGKLLHGIFSAGLIFLLFRLFSFSQPVSSYLAQQVSGMASLGFSRAFLISAAASLVIVVAILGLYCYDCRKNSRKRK